MKNCIKPLLIFVFLLFAASLGYSQCNNVVITNNLTMAVDVTINDNCGGTYGPFTVPATGTPTSFSITACSTGMLNGHLDIPSGPCQGGHPICPPSAPQPCGICANAIYITTTVVPASPCDYNIVIN